MFACALNSSKMHIPAGIFKIGCNSYIQSQFPGIFLIFKLAVRLRTSEVSKNPDLPDKWLNSLCNFVVSFCFIMFHYVALCFLLSVLFWIISWQIFLTIFLTSFLTNYLTTFLTTFLKKFLTIFLKNFLTNFWRTFDKLLRNFLTNFLMNFLTNFMTNFLTNLFWNTTCNQDEVDSKCEFKKALTSLRVATEMNVWDRKSILWWF